MTATATGEAGPAGAEREFSILLQGHRHRRHPLGQVLPQTPKAKRAATKKAPIKAPGPPPLQGAAAAETVTVDVIEEPVPGVTVVTEFEATRVQGSEE